MQSNRIRFADSYLDDVAAAMVDAQPIAAQYLEQAPALAVLACQKLPTHITYGELDAFAACAATQPRLRDVLSRYSAPQPLRRLAAISLRAKDRPVLAELARLDASTLAQAIPGDSQRVWLDGLHAWLRLAPNDKRKRQCWNIGWIARRLGEDLSRFEQVGALIDFLGRGGGTLNEKWTWASAMAAVEAWHHSLRSDAQLRALIAAKKEAEAFDKVICRSGLPDLAEVEGYTFHVLRTLRRLREEGSAMHHCVAAYSGDVKRGRCAIASVRRDGVNVATLEIANGSAKQIKAHCNQAVTPAVRTACETYVLLHWRAPESAA